MRRSLTTAVLLAAIAAAACTDTAPTGPWLRPDGLGPVLNQGPAEGYVDRLIPKLFPKGLETATGKRWDHVKSTRKAGDIATAAKHMRDLAKYVGLKTAEIENFADEFASQRHAATSLVLAMGIFVHVGPNAEVPTTQGDVAFAVVPAGEAATVVTPAQQAALDIPAGASSVDRLITIYQTPTDAFPGHCNGPLPTNRCQYPLFYDISSFPPVDFDELVAVSVCPVTRPSTDGTRDRSPLDNPALPQPDNEAVHNRLALARRYISGRVAGVVEGQIEVLPERANQKGLTLCEDIPTPVAFATPRGGWLGRAERGLLAVASLVGSALTPRNLYAIDAGPEHETYGLGGSPINAVDPQSQPDLEAKDLSAPSRATQGQAILVDFAVANTSRRSGGNATAAADPTSATVYLVRTVTGDDETQAAQTEEHVVGTVSIDLLRPDANHVVDDLSLTIPPNLDPGSWLLEVRVAGNTGLAEVTLANNRTSRQIEIDPAEVLTTITFDGVSLINDCDGPSGCGNAFVQGGYVVQSFWYDPPQAAPPHWLSAHFHLLTTADGNVVEDHHAQDVDGSGLGRQGARIRRQDGKAFTLKSIDYRSANTPFEIGTTAITSVVGTPPRVSGYTQFPVTSSSLFQTLQVSGFANVTEVWITMPGSGTWDNIVLGGPPVAILAASLQATQPTLSAAKLESSRRYRVVEGRDVLDP